MLLAGDLGDEFEVGVVVQHHPVASFATATTNGDSRY